jgi:hypothetical protein
MASIRIRAQALRRTRAAKSPGDIEDFASVPDEPAPPKAGRKPGWRQADVRRAIAAAEQAGLRHYRVEIAPDGTIAIVVGPAPEGEAGDG